MREEGCARCGRDQKLEPIKFQASSARATTARIPAGGAPPTHPRATHLCVCLPGFYYAGVVLRGKMPANEFVLEGGR